MNINVLATGSSGNCYIFTDSQGNQLLLEAGIKYEQIIPHLNFEKLDCLLYSHEHNDHYLCVDKFRDYVKVIGSKDNEVGKTIFTKNWIILPIKCYHNVECFGYIISNKTESKKILFCTDTKELPKVADTHFDIMMLECNYDYDSVITMAQKGKAESDGYKNHLALETLVDWLKVREDKPNFLMAVHLSTHNNINKSLMVQQLTPFADTFVVAKKNVQVEI